VRDPNNPCLFCTARDVTREHALAWATRDTYPVSPGHTLVIPRRHCADFFELTPEEMAACMALLVAEQRVLAAELKPDGYNVGVNVGRAGGQSILHVHLHLIPRFAGDADNPQGGVRRILPLKADYPRGPVVSS
jgi:diadenosine tetraphosphate (Ap4A) HIT family hydrolase